MIMIEEMIREKEAEKLPDKDMPRRLANHSA